jgi:light-regulated signal transduction histidine kinase (bacteriophytochrome)
MKVGAFDYILKPFKLSVILPVLSRALAMRRLRMENAQLEQRLRERAAELEAANKELETFSYSVSHDLRSPLRAIDGYTAMIEKQLGDKLDDLGKRLFNVVRDSSRKMGILIDDMLEFSRLGRQPISARTVDMTAVVSEAWSEIRTGSPEGAPDFRLQTLPGAWGDPALLKQVWTNLLSNALKYSGKTARPMIEVSGEEQPAEIAYCVRDNGVGFDMQYYDKLFEVFQRLHSERDFSGTGVGLAIVQRVVTRHGGRVWAEGKANAGAAFFFTLPIPKTEVLS